MGRASKSNPKSKYNKKRGYVAKPVIIQRPEQQSDQVIIEPQVFDATVPNIFNKLKDFVCNILKSKKSSQHQSQEPTS
jgi:hypothetical protein